MRCTKAPISATSLRDRRPRPHPFHPAAGASRARGGSARRAWRRRAGTRRSRCPPRRSRRTGRRGRVSSFSRSSQKRAIPARAASSRALSRWPPGGRIEALVDQRPDVREEDLVGGGLELATARALGEIARIERAARAVAPPGTRRSASSRRRRPRRPRAPAPAPSGSAPPRRDGAARSGSRGSSPPRPARRRAPSRRARCGPWR